MGLCQNSWNEFFSLSLYLKISTINCCITESHYFFTKLHYLCVLTDFGLGISVVSENQNGVWFCFYIIWTTDTMKRHLLANLGRFRMLVLRLNVASVVFQGNSACVSPRGPFKSLKRSTGIECLKGLILVWENRFFRGSPDMRIPVWSVLSAYWRSMQGHGDYVMVLSCRDYVQYRCSSLCDQHLMES